MGGYDGSAVDAFDYHHSMLVDEVRTSSFLRAITEVVKPGDVVVDIGSGTGVLALFAVMAGASRVFAIESEPVIQIAGEIAARNGMSEVISFVAGSSLEVEIPQRADVLITETIGNVGFDEGISTWVADARTRFLKQDASVVPGSVDTVASLVSVPRDFRAVERWSQQLHTLDFTPVTRIIRNNLQWIDLSPAAIVSEPAVVFGRDFSAEPEPLAGSVRVEAIKDAFVHGIGIWFRSSLTPSIEITNAPPNTVPSWEQGFLPLDESLEVAAGDQIRFEVASSESGEEWTWRVGSGRTHCTSDGRLSMPKVMEAAHTSHGERSNYAEDG